MRPSASSFSASASKGEPGFRAAAVCDVNLWVFSVICGDPTAPLHAGNALIANASMHGPIAAAALARKYKTSDRTIFDTPADSTHDKFNLAFPAPAEPFCAAAVVAAAPAELAELFLFPSATHTGAQGSGMPGRIAAQRGRRF